MREGDQMTEKHIFEREGDNVYYRDFGAPANSRQLLTGISKQEEFEFMKNDKQDSLDIIQNDIYDTADIIASDTSMLVFLRVLADEESDNTTSEYISRIADRFEKLSSSAHNRKHWTGHE